MKYQYFTLLFIFSLVVSFFELDTNYRLYSANEITKETLKKEIISRMERVDELRVMKEVAKELGIKQVYLFGGSAAAWAHYVYWDLEREAGMGHYHESRFDYDYTSIFRSNQDMDIVIDVDENNQHLVSLFEQKMQETFPHFQGNKSAWEVRPLRFDYGDKEKILANPDFLNQNSDSHSTGLISITDNDEFGIRDFKSWDSLDNHFFNDVFNRELHYYRDQVRHRGTKRFQEGLNPEVFSAVRYLTKAFQYELSIDEESLKELKSVFSEFDSSVDLKKSYSKNWLEKNGKKLYQNAIDIEYAYQVMLKFSLQEKLQELRGNVNKSDSLAWWMNKFPLLTKPLGNEAQGKTAKELGIDIVAHETNNFAAYESITKSHSGVANVFISRQGFSEEAARYGDGFYVKIGTKGAVGTGLTIRFKLQPEAIEGVDFDKKGKFLIIKNKAALEVIPESLNLSILEYYKKIANRELIFDSSDKGVREKVKRKILLQSQKLSKDELDEIADIVRENLTYTKKNKINEALINEWFSLKESTWYPDIAQKALDIDIVRSKVLLTYEHWAQHNLSFSFIQQVFNRKVPDFFDGRQPYINFSIAENILSKKFWAEHEKSTEILINFFNNKYLRAEDAAEYILSEQHWAEHEDALLFLDTLFELKRAKKPIAQYVLSKEFWAKKENTFQYIERLFNEKYDFELAYYILSRSYWSKNEKSVDILEKILRRGKVNSEIIRKVLSTEHWANHERGFEFLDYLLKGRDYNKEIAQYILTKDFWAKHEKSIEILEEVMDSGFNSSYITRHAFLKKFWLEHERSDYLIGKILSSPKVHSGIIYNIGNEEVWKNYKRVEEVVENIFNQETADKFILVHLLSQEKWATREQGLNYLLTIAKRGNVAWMYYYNALSNDFWLSHPYFVEKFKGQEVTPAKIISYLKKRNGLKVNCINFLTRLIK